MEVSAPRPGASCEPVTLTDEVVLELKVSFWMPDGITTTGGTQASEEVHRFSLLTSLSFSPSVTLRVGPLTNRQWPFCPLGNLSQVSSMPGTVEMCDEADFYEYLSPGFTLSEASLAIKLFPCGMCKVQQMCGQVREQGELFTQKPAEPV